MAKWLMLAFLLFLASPVFGGAPRLTNMDAEGLLTYHADLARALDGRGYSHITASDRQDIDRAQALIRERLAGYDSMDELPEPARVEVFNAHERIVGVIEEAEDERLVCNRRKVTGSHQVVVVCDKAGKIERSRQKLATEEVYRKNINRPPPDGGP